VIVATFHRVVTAVKCQLGVVERGGMGVAVTEQRDEDQEGGGRRVGGGRTSPNT